MPKPSLQVSNKPLSISNLTGISSFSLNLSSDNIGVVEIMLLHLLEKAISSKSSWILETKNSMITLQRLRLKDCSPPTFVVPEHFCPDDTPETPPQPSVFPEHRNFDPDIAAIERELISHVSILTKLLWRYNLVPSILSNDPALADFIPSTGQTIDWRPLQLTRLRWSLLRVFSHREEPITFSQRRSPERSVSVENFIGAFAGMSSTRSSPSLNTSHTGDPILTETITALAPNINVRTDVPRSTRNQLMAPRFTSKFPPMNINEEESSPLFHDPSRYSHVPPPPPPFIKPTSALNNHFHRKNKNPDTSNASSTHSSEPVVLGRFIRIATLELPSAGLADLACSSQSPSLFPQRMFENPACSFQTVTSPASVIHRIAVTRKSLLAQTSSTPPADEKSYEFR